MASDTAVAGILAFLHELFPTRELSDRALDAWLIVFADWSDDELKACARAAAREPGRAFFPTPGEIAAYRPVPTVDVDQVLGRIAKLGGHNPRTGWVYPRAEDVRAQLGPAIADAYAAAGGDQCFAVATSDGATVTRDIARRAFAAELTTAQRREPSRPLLPPPAPAPLLLEPETRERVPLAERPVAEQERIRGPKPAKTVMQLSIAYVAAQQAHGKTLAEDPAHADAFQLCLGTTERKYREFAMPDDKVLNAAHRDFARRHDFPPFATWCWQQGYDPEGDKPRRPTPGAESTSTAWPNALSAEQEPAGAASGEEGR